MSFQKVTHILYIEDDEGLARLLQKYLQRCGYAVDIASDGEEGLTMLETGRYNIFIVDYNLPGFGGLDVIRSLASRENPLPGIMVTGDGNELVAVEAMKLGATDYIVKDVNMRYLELLPLVIEQALQKQQLITEKQLMLETIQESEERYRRLFEISTDGILIYDDWRLQFINPAGVRLLGAPNPEELIGRSIFDFIHPDYWQIFKDRLTEIDKHEKKVPWFEGKLKHLNGDVLYVEMMAVSFKDLDGKQAVQVIMRDISERKMAEQRLQYLAHFDPLTGIPNRTLFFDRLSQAMGQARRYEHMMAVLFLDLDKFKDINDALGHEAGDIVLRESAKRLKKCIRKTDTIARMGGDEFIIVLTKVNKPDDAKIIAQRILASYQSPFSLKGKERTISISVGISLFPRAGSDPEILVRNADTALYRAKEQGGNTFQFYT